jgi:predicted RNA-binding protein with PIN domain
VRTFLIDGYNLMHAAGLMAARSPAVKLQKARGKFLDWIADADPVRAGTARVRVIFDAQNGTGDGREKAHRAGVWVRFAPKETADDLIEHILAADQLPHRLTVVSNDGRLHEAARRRSAHRWTCEAFMDWLATGTPGPGAYTALPPATSPDSPAGSGVRYRPTLRLVKWGRICEFC